MVSAERRPLELSAVPVRRAGRTVWRSALVAAAALVVVAMAVNWRQGTVEMESPPASVEQMEREARRDVEDDATNAGLKALGSKDSLAATLTGGLKKQLENMDTGDHELMARIEAKVEGKSTKGAAKAAAKVAVAAKAAKVAAAAKQVAAKAASGARGRTANRQPPKPVLRNVVSAVQRDRKHEMMSMSKALARVSLLRKQVNERAKEEAKVHHEVKGAVKTGKEVKNPKAVVKVATAKALLVKANELEKRAAEIKRAALFKALPNERALEAAMKKQKAVLNKLKNSDKVANSKTQAQAQRTQAKAMSQKSIQELKLAGDLIKQSNAPGSKLTAKQTAKLQKKSENLTEKAVHTMLESRKMSHKADDMVRQANAMVSQLPELETKARQSKLVLKVLSGQRKADIAGLTNNKGYQAAATLARKLVSESHKDHKLAKAMLQQEKTMGGKMKAAIIQAKQASSKIIKADQMTVSELHHLRLALAAEKKNVEEDDSILSALK
jgi:hypothetical protein